MECCADVRTPSPAGDARPPQLIDLALQGGGAHGAFTWGVLDRLLEEPWLADRGHFRHLGRRHECRRAGRRPRQGRRRRRARGAGGLLAQGFRGRPVQPVAAQPARRAARPLDARPLAGLHRPRSDGARVLALRSQLRRHQSADADPGRSDRLRAPRQRRRSSSSSRRPMSAPDAAARVPQRRDHARRAARLGLPADHVPGGGDRRRSLLGRRLFRQSDHDAAGAGMRVGRHDPRRDQSGRAPGHPALGPRHPQPSERGVVQRGAAEGTADDRAAAAGRRCRQHRGRALGAHAHPPDPRAT